jgi:hypothetical protein
MPDDELSLIVAWAAFSYLYQVLVNHISECEQMYQNLSIISLYEESYQNFVPHVPECEQIYQKVVNYIAEYEQIDKEFVKFLNVKKLSGSYQ